MKEATAPQIKQLSLSAIAEDLNNGLTKWKKDDIGFGSIEKKYNLLTNEAIELFGHPKVKKMETRIPTFIIVDDLPEEESNNEIETPQAVLAVEPIEKSVVPVQTAIIEVVKQHRKPVNNNIQAFI